MSVSAGTARVRYIGSGSAGPFAFNFTLYHQTHLNVVHTDTDGVDTELVLTTDYTVSVAADFSSATLTLVTPLAGDGVDDGGSEILTITRDPPIEQLTRWPRSDPFPAQTHERAADLAVMLIDRLNEKIGRSLLLPESSTLSDLRIPAPVANMALGWNADADNLTNVGVSTAYAQDEEPTGSIVFGSLWIDTDSANNDLYRYDGSDWIDTGVDLKGDTGLTGAAGADGDDGEDGAPGLMPGYLFAFSTTTAMADPGAGVVRLNNAALASVTAAAFDDTSAESGNPDVSAAVLSWDDSTSAVRGYLLLKKVSAPGNFALYAITGASTDNAGWTQLALTYVTHSGSFDDADVLSVESFRTGDNPLASIGVVKGVIPIGNGSALVGLPVGSDGQIPRADSTDAEGVVWGSPVTSSAVQAATSGTAIDVTGIPAWVNRITVCLDAVSLSGTDSFVLQLGDAGGFETTGYTSVAAKSSDSASTEVDTLTSGFLLKSTVGGSALSGHVTLTKIPGTNRWVQSHVIGDTGDGNVCYGGGSKTLSDTLTQIRLTRTGANTFDGSGQLHVLYE